MSTQVEFLTLATRLNGDAPSVSRVKLSKYSVQFDVVGSEEAVDWAHKQLDQKKSLVRIGEELYVLRPFYGVISKTKLEMSASLELLNHSEK